MNIPLLLPSLYSQSTGKPDIPALKFLAGEHPYSSLIQFYLLHALKDNTEARDAQAGKTALFFNNHQWLSACLMATLESTPQPIIDTAGDKLIQPGPDNNIAATDPPPDPGDALTFEPLHLVDYFASQGISLSGQEKTNDKLGKQLKSFTEWLKTMKKIHPEKMEATNEATDQKIQSIAESSNDETDVITEAMAEVLEKQGKHAKAIEIYDKLSLINPAKSAYFAAKINSLKGS